MAEARIAIALVLVFLAPAHGQTSPDTQVVTLPAPETSTATKANEPAWQAPVDTRRGLMWQASSAHNTVYLVGSIHLASRDLYPLPEQIEQAFRESNVLVVEVDLNRLDRGKFQSLMASDGLYPRTDSLWNHIRPSTRQLVADFCEKHGLNPEGFARMKPWMAALATSLLPVATMQHDFAPGIDKHFLDEAGAGVRVAPLESAEYQFRVLSGLPEAQQERSLVSAVKNAGESKEDFHKLETFWLEGDAGKLDAYLSASMRDEPEYQKRIFTDRNPHMADRAEQCLKSGERCFVVVGAGHMVGKDGIVRLLQNRGYKVEQVLATQ